jgi:hypothetical protein
MLGLDAILNIGGKLIDKLIPDPEAKAKAQLDLATLAQNGELAHIQADIDRFKAEVEDRDSARKAHAEVATSANSTPLDKAVVPLLALGVVGLAFMLIAVLMFVDTPDNQQQLVIFALGFVTSAAGQVLSFYFGSSQGSKDKTKEMEGMVRNATK